MSLRVRQIDRREWLLAQTATECQRHGQEATLEYPTRQGMWVRLSDAEKRWSAWIQPGDWLEHVSPALAGRRFLLALSTWSFPGLLQQSDRLSCPCRICPVGVYA